MDIVETVQCNPISQTWLKPHPLECKLPGDIQLFHPIHFWSLDKPGGICFNTRVLLRKESSRKKQRSSWIRKACESSSSQRAIISRIAWSFIQLVNRRLPQRERTTVKERPWRQQRTPWGACLVGYKMKLNKQKGRNRRIKETTTANSIGQFRVSESLFQNKSSCQSFHTPVWKLTLICMTIHVQIRHLSLWTVLQKDSFWRRGMRQLKKGLSKKRSRFYFLYTFPTTLYFT